MSGKWPGGFITKTAPTVVGPVDGEGGSASGVWTLDQVADYAKQGLWPKPILDKELYAWGNNNSGQLGLGDVTNRSSPVQVGALITWSKIAGGERYSLAITTDGKLYAWGKGTNGRLGTGNTTDRNSPVQVGALTNWAQITAGAQHSLSVKTDGTLWAWGGDPFNQGPLGLDDTTNRSSPVQVGALTNWAQVSGGEFHSVAIKTDGTLWSWGGNGQGQLGLGDTTNRSSPVQVGALTNWDKVVTGSLHTVAIKTDGTMWTWGYNTGGALGLGDTTNRSSPVQVGALTTWATDFAAGSVSSFAIKTDGTFWSWGSNNSGQLGLNIDIFTNISSPTQVGALTTWSKIGPLQKAVLATTTDGKLYAWGNNQFGELGLGNTTYYSSPVQVGALTTWGILTKGSQAQHSLAITKS